MKPTIHEHAMHLAIQSAMQGIKDNEGGPFGACIVRHNQIIAVAHNTVLKDHDPTCHAEMNAIRLAAKSLGTYILSECEIYSTVEPCPMCLAAIYWARIDKIYAAADKRLAARFGFDDEFFYQQIQQKSSERHVPCEIGMLNQDSEAVFEQWVKLGRTLY